MRILLIMLVSLIVFSNTVSFADEILWGSSPDMSAKSVWNASANAIYVNTGTDQVPAIQEVLSAMCSNGGGTLNFDQPGIIHLGSTGANRFYSGIQVTCSNITLTANPGFGVEFRPLFTHGGSLLSVCPAFDNTPNYGNDKDCLSAPDLSNIVIENLYFHDDAPADHCANYRPALGVCSIDGTVANKGEETHAIFIGHTNESLITNNKVESLGDEGIVVQCHECVVSKNWLIDTPSIRGSGGSPIEINGSNVLVTENVIQNIQADPLSDGVACAGSCQNSGSGISIATNLKTPEDVGIDVFNIVISNNTLTDIDSWYGITIGSNNASVIGAKVTGNSVRMKNQNGDACIPGTFVYDPDAGTPVVSTPRCAIAATGVAPGTAGFTRNGIVIADNDVTGPIATPSTGASGILGSLTIKNNLIGGDGVNSAGAAVAISGYGIRASGSPLTIDGNTISRFTEGAIYLLGLDVDTTGTESVSIANNAIIENNADSTPEDGITAFAPAGVECGSDGLIRGGITLSSNRFIANSSGAIARMVDLHPCTKWTSSSDYFDGNGSSIANSGLQNPAIVTNTTVKNTGSAYSIMVGDGAIVSNNRIENATNRSIFGSLADDVIVTGNTIVDGWAVLAAEVSGSRAICTNNISMSTNPAVTTVGTFRCGTDGSGAGCSVDALADGICSDNQALGNGGSGVGALRTKISTYAELQALFASGTGFAYISDTLTETSTGTAAGSAFDLTVPDDGSIVDIDIEWRDGASIIWNSTGTQPASGTTRNGFEVDFGNGTQAEGSRVILRNLKYRHHIDGAIGGLTTITHQGVVFVNRATTGSVRNLIQLWNPDIFHRDDGSSSIAGGSVPSSPLLMEIYGGSIHGPIGWDVKHRCDPADCTGAGSYFYGTAVSSDSEFNTPRCIKGDNEGIAYFDGGTARECYFDMNGNSSVYVNGTTLLNMPATLSDTGSGNPNDPVFLMSGSTAARGSFFLRGAGESRTDNEGLVIINSTFLGSFDLSGTAMDCLGPFWYSTPLDTASGWGVMNTSGSAAYSSGRLKLRGPTNAGAECGPRDSALMNGPEPANGVQIGIDVGVRKLYYNTLEAVSMGVASQAKNGADHVDGYRFTITNDLTVGACTDATSDGTLDGGGSATSTCAWNGTSWVN